MNANQNVQFLPSFPQPKKIPATTGSPRSGVAVEGSINNFEKKTIAVNGVEHQQTFDIKNLGKRSIWFSEELTVISSILVTKDTL